MIVRRYIVVLFPIFVTSGACSSESNGSDSSAGTGSCAELASAACGALVRCGGPAFELQFSSDTECMNQFTRQCELEGQAPGSGFGPAFIGACTAAYGDKSCDELRYGRTPECETPTGSLPDGSGCAYDSQCASGSCFEPFASGGCGWCLTPITVGEGADCGGYDPATGAPVQCANGLECESSTSGTGYVCVVTGALDAPCGGETQRCNDGLVCVNSKCEKGGQAGAPCNSASECDLFAGFSCNPLLDQCQPLQIADSGQTCGMVDGTLRLCRQGADCEGLSPVTTQGTCAALIPEGEPCQYGDSCQGISECTATTPDDPGTCGVPDPSACQTPDGGA